jgi:flagellin-like protein
MKKQSNEGISEVIATILLVALVVILAAVIGSIVFGVIELQPKSAYIPPEVKLASVNNTQVISLYSKGGDQAVLWPLKTGQYALAVYLDTPSGSFQAVPDSGVENFNPGQTLFIYNSSSGLHAAYNLTGKTLLPLPQGSVNLRIVDENAQLLVYKQGLTIGSGGTVTVSPTPTCVEGTAWRIRNKFNVSFAYTLKDESTGNIIEQGVIAPGKEIHLWYAKTVPPNYWGNLTWNSTPQEFDRNNNGVAWCSFNRYITDVSLAQGNKKYLELFAGDA